MQGMINTQALEKKKYGFDSKIPLQKSVVKSQHVCVACGFV